MKFQPELANNFIGSNIKTEKKSNAGNVLLKLIAYFIHVFFRLQLATTVVSVANMLFKKILFLKTDAPIKQLNEDLASCNGRVRMLDGNS